jgi:hypothetical protein
MSIIFNVGGIGKKHIGATNSIPKTLSNYAKSKGLGVKKLSYSFQGINYKKGYALTKDVGLKDRLMEVITIAPTRDKENKWSVTYPVANAPSNRNMRVLYAKNMSDVVNKLKKYASTENVETYKYIK